MATWPMSCCSARSWSGRRSSFRAARGRDRVAGTVYPSGSLAATAITVVVGTVAWVVFTLWLHLMLIGVRPFG